MTHATTWMNLKDIRQSQKAKYCVSPRIRGSWRSQVHRHRKLNDGYKGLGRGEGEVGVFALNIFYHAYLRCRELVFKDDKNVGKMVGAMGAQQCENPSCHRPCI